jgi:type VI secretion system protein ImpL
VLAIILVVLFLALLWAITLFFGLPLWIAIATTAFLLLVLGARFAYNMYRAKQGSLEIERSLARQAKQYENRARPDQMSEARALAANFEKALATLKSSKLARGRGGALYSLPWYVIIGPPGAGKSTAIRQSGLKFPLLGGQNAVRGIGGTRNCDWWLTNEAVLLDTAGRYATEDDDRDEWLSFLDILKRSRPKRPLNGLIIAISASELAAANDSQLETLAGKIRERLDEVMGRLELVLPVYVLLTKCDLLPGFMETFEDMKRTERSQVFGFTFPLHDRSELAPRAEQQWIRVEQVIERNALRRMAEVRNPQARQRIYEFPQQVEALRPKIAAFLNATFVDNVYQDAPIVRGVYLTSGAQVGNLVDQLMGSMAAAFGLPPPQSGTAQRAESKSFFLGDFFRNVMFPDREVAVQSTLGQRRREAARLLAAALLLVGSLGPVALALRAYAANRNTILSARNELATAMAYRGEDQKAAVPLAVLEPIRARLVQLASWEQEGAPWSQRMGLYEGNELLPYLRSFYTATLRRVLMQPLVLQIADELAQSVKRNAGLGNVPSVTDQALTYERLRAYLLLTLPREPSTPALDEEVRKWLTVELVNAWAARTQGSAPSPADRAAMGVHVAEYLGLMAQDENLGFVHDPQIIHGAREMLGRVPAVKLAVDRVVATVEPLGWDIGLEHLVGATGLPLTATGRIRGAFTRRAWDESLRALFSSDPQALLGDSWVFAGSDRKTDETDETRLCALRSEYFGRYVADWRDFIGTLRMEEPLDHARAGAVLQDLTRGQPPPLERVMRAIAFHSQLGEDKKKPSEAEKVAESTGMLDKLAELRKKAEASPLGGLIAKKNPCLGAEYVTEASVRTVLSGFFSFGASLEEPQAGAPAPLTSVQIYQEQLTYVRDALQSYVDDPTTSDALLARLQAARTRVRSLIETQEIGWRPRFDALLWPPINGASISSSAAMAGEKGSRWCTSVLLPFARTLRDRYPFVKNGQDVALADLAEFYRPSSGILWAFYDAVLKREVTQVGSKFQLVMTNNTSMYNNELVRFLDRSFALTTVLFPARAEKPRVDFEVRVRPSPGIAQVLLTIDGQLVDFHNGPEKWIRITWPGEGGKPGAQMRVKGANIDETLGQEGEWGLFRLLDKGTISANPGERFFTARWRLHTQNDVTVDIRPARSENPFVGQRAYLEAFRADGVIAPAVIAIGAKPCSE